jgi:pyrimidine operon attenuation protein / uracil phosphoribosyltransferase
MKKYILDAATAALKMERMAYEIVEENIDETELILAGIRDNGSVIARSIQQELAKISSLKTKLINLQLDKKHPTTVELSENLDFNGKVVIVVDDVSNSGKTMLYALKPLLEFHPKKIETLVLVERSHKIFPVNSDFVGLSVATTLQEHIFVEVEGEKIKGAYLE